MTKTVPARRAAKKPNLYGKSHAPEEESRQHVLFCLGDECYGVALELVQEILVARDITEVPFTPDHVAGIVNLRGRIVTVVDLRRRIGMAAAPLTRASRIVVVEYRDQSIGLIVDNVPAVIFIPTSRIEPDSTLISGKAEGDIFSGIANLEEGVIPLIDLDKTLRKQTGREIAKSGAS